MKYAFFFQPIYNLHNNYILIDAPTELDAKELFEAARRDMPEGYADAHVRYSTCIPFDELAEAMCRHQGVTEVDINTPITQRRVERPAYRRQ